MFAKHLAGGSGIWAGDFYDHLEGSPGRAGGLLNSVDSILPDDNYHAI